MRRRDFVTPAIIVGVVGGLYLLVRSGKFRPVPPTNIGDRPPDHSTVVGAVDPAGFVGTQSANGPPVPSTPGPSLGNNPPPVIPSSDGSQATTWGAPLPEPYRPGFSYYDQIWTEEVKVRIPLY